MPQIDPEQFPVSVPCARGGTLYFNPESFAYRFVSLRGGGSRRNLEVIIMKALPRLAAPGGLFTFEELKDAARELDPFFADRDETYLDRQLMFEQAYLMNLGIVRKVSRRGEPWTYQLHTSPIPVFLKRLAKGNPPDFKEEVIAPRPATPTPAMPVVRMIEERLREIGDLRTALEHEEAILRAALEGFRELTA